jgi:class 3 adenylate cyclase/predicted ATPase/energy-coupling factor transporter ATP-binding protein EcfA2
MRCTKCGAKSNTGRKFCTACGSPLSTRCPKCGAENVPLSAYCEDCGSALTPDASPAALISNQIKPTSTEIRFTSVQPGASLATDGERKTVTALFADIKGSTELTRDIDPEEARAIIDPALKIMIDAVRRYEGYVVQSLGDGIFALFGAPLAHEDHPQRALYAALDMQKALRDQAARLETQGKPTLEARIGINSGEVVMRTVETGGRVEYTPVGHVSNLAARMQTIAPAGGIAISEETRRLVEGYFELRGLGPTEVKGVAEPLNVYEVTGLGSLRTHFQVSARRGLTKFVGREHEIAEMKRALSVALGEQGQIVALVGEAGAGKSRLVHEFKAMLPSESKLLEAYSVSHGKASPYQPAIELLNDYFGIRAEDDEQRRRERVSAKITAIEPALNDTLPYLFMLLGIPETTDLLAQMDAQIKRRRTLEAIKRILFRESLTQPLVVIFEDLHWLDSETEALLKLLADSLAVARILLLVNYRPEYRCEWGSRSYYTELRIDPLGQDEAESLLTSLLGDAAELEPLRRLIIERTGGNPFFIEEMVQTLFEQGVLARNGVVTLARAVTEIKVPSTVQGVLASRIDRLPQRGKDLLQTLAVIGRESSLGLITSVSPDAKEELELMLSDLQLAEFVYEQPALADTEYIFKHALTQEVAYNSILIERRKQIHTRIGQALESLFKGRLDDHLSDLAYHYARSTDIPKAIEYLQRAGELALARSSFRDAVDKLNSAIEFTRSLPAGNEQTRQEMVLQLLLGSALTGFKGYGSADREAAYRRAAQLCHQTEENRDLFPVLWNLCQLNIQRAELETARELGYEALRLAERLQDPTLIGPAEYNLGEICFWAGEPFKSLEHCERAGALYDLGAQSSTAWLYGMDLLAMNSCVAAFAEFMLGNPDQALNRTRAARERAGRNPHLFSRTYALTGVAGSYVLSRAVDETKEVAEQAIAVCTEHGLTELLAWAKCLRGLALVGQGMPSEGIAELTEGIEVSDSVGLQVSRTMFVCFLAEGYAKAGNRERASQLLAEAFDRASRTGERFYECELHRLQGEVDLMGDRPNTKAAYNRFRAAVELARKQGTKAWELRATVSLARLLAKQDDGNEARTMLAEIYGWFTEGFDTADLKDAKALLDELSA